jgi:hypothetical protein
LHRAAYNDRHLLACDVDRRELREAELLIDHDGIVLVLLLLLFVGREIALRDEGNLLAVGRPLELRDAALARRERVGLAAHRRNQIELRPLVAGRDEGDPLAVGRPAWRAIGLFARREANRLAAARRDEIDVRVTGVGDHIGFRDDVRHPFAVGRELRIAHGLEGDDVVERHTLRALGGCRSSSETDDGREGGAGKGEGIFHRVESAEEERAVILREATPVAGVWRAVRTIHMLWP